MQIYAIAYNDMSMQSDDFANKILINTVFFINI